MTDTTTFSTFIVQTDEHADERGNLAETGDFEVREILANGDSQAVDCCLTARDAHNLRAKLSGEAADVTSAHAPMLTDEQRETWRAWRRAVDLIADEGVRIDRNPKIAEALEDWAMAYAEASR